MMRFAAADGILDLRSFEDFKQGHLQASTWMAWQDLPEHLNELPASPAKLFLVGPHQAIEEASCFLHAKGYDVNGSLLISTPEDMAKWQQKLPGLVVSGSTSKALWSANALLKEFVQNHQIEGQAGRPTALDLGCGGGRDAVFLAKQGWQVTAIDQQAAVIKRAKQLANRSGAAVKWKCCDLKTEGCLPQTDFDLVLMVRYLNRELFASLRQAIRPGGYLLIQTFAEGAEAFGSPKNPNFLLAPGELAEVFGDFSIIVDRIDCLADGRPVASFIAQKPLDGVHNKTDMECV
jgi:SAM-dependent methyltransferase